MPSSNTDMLGSNRICSDCVGETFLKQCIATDGIHDFCFYCDEENPTITVEELANIIEQAFEDHFERTESEADGWEYAMTRDPELDYEWEREGEEAVWAIANAAEINEEIAEDIRQILEDRHGDFELAAMGDECPFSKESHYAEKHAGHGEFTMLWNDFETGLKTQSRFFSRSAKSILDQIFAGIPELRTSNGTSIMVDAGPETNITALYRARVFAGEDEKLKEALIAPWKHLGTPPSHAATAGRMNARGISVFYGALDAETALSEVRPPVGSRVAIARFGITRPLRLLDISALTSVADGGSIFDPATIVKMQRGNFLEILSWRMSRAIMPHEEASEYLPTQAVADYLAIEAGLDGMIFPSVQAGHQSANVVLFHHVSRVEEVTLPKGTRSTAYLETTDSDGSHPEYGVWEKVPVLSASGASPKNQEAFNLVDFHDHFEQTDWRENTLAIDLTNIQVRHVNAVRFSTDPHPVSRTRIEQQDSGPGSDVATDPRASDEGSDDPFG